MFIYKIHVIKDNQHINENVICQLFNDMNFMDEHEQKVNKIPTTLFTLHKSMIFPSFYKSFCHDIPKLILSYKISSF